MMDRKSKLPEVQPSIFPVMTSLAKAHNAINLAQGFPGFQADPKLIERIFHYAKQGFNQYAPLTGFLSLKEKIAEKINDLYCGNYDPETEICLTAGATQAVHTAITAFVGQGDEVLVIEPTFDIYIPGILMNKGIPVPSAIGTNMKINWEDLKQKVSPKTKMLIINSPQNPLGITLKQSDIDALCDLVRGTNIVVLSDEVYEHITFDGKKHLSLASIPELRERTLITCSFGKTYHLTGWRTGYVYGPKKLMEEFVKCHTFQVYSVNTPIQLALRDYMTDPSKHLELSEFFQEKRDFFLNCIKGSNWTFTPSEGTYFQLLNYGKISQENEVEFAKRLTIEHGVASIPISVFYKDGRNQNLLRFCFAKENEELERAAEKLQKL